MFSFLRPNVRPSYLVDIFLDLDSISVPFFHSSFFVLILVLLHRGWCRSRKAKDKAWRYKVQLVINYVDGLNGARMRRAKITTIQNGYIPN